MQPAPRSKKTAVVSDDSDEDTPVTRKPAGRAMRDRKQVVKYTVLDSSDNDDESIMTPDNDDDSDF